MMKKIIQLNNKLQYFVVLGLLFLPFVLNADGKTPVLKLKNPIGNIKSLEAFINEILGVVITIATPVAILAIIYSGFLFVKAQGNDSKLTEAKEVLKWTLIGIMVLLGAQLLSSVIAGTITSLK